MFARWAGVVKVVAARVVAGLEAVRWLAAVWLMRPGIDPALGFVRTP